MPCSTASCCPHGSRGSPLSSAPSPQRRAPTRSSASSPLGGSRRPRRRRSRPPASSTSSAPRRCRRARRPDVAVRASPPFARPRHARAWPPPAVAVRAYYHAEYALCSPLPRMRAREATGCRTARVTRSPVVLARPWVLGVRAAGVATGVDAHRRARGFTAATRLAPRGDASAAVCGPRRAPLVLATAYTRAAAASARRGGGLACAA
eukprot:3181566-Prymnesium_polylepis.1